jgi:hypothetical protein
MPPWQELLRAQRFGPSLGGVEIQGLQMLGEGGSSPGLPAQVPLLEGRQMQPQLRHQAAALPLQGPQDLRARRVCGIV